jgi:H+-translocating NAD(P) transhydrogenase subunit alpha
MRIAIPRETHPGENRVPVTPETAKKLCRLGADLVIENGMGLGLPMKNMLRRVLR